MLNPKVPEPMFPVDVAGAPTITLAGRDWPVPKLAPKQARHVTPALMELLPLVGQMHNAVEVDGSGAIVVKDEDGILRAMTSITEKAYGSIEQAVFWSLKRAHPQLSFAEFEEMPIDLMEMLRALPVILRQVGFIKMKAAGDTAPGERPAVDR